MRNLCAITLAAGSGERLRPLTTLRPKALCPINNVPLLDLGLARLAALGLVGPAAVAVNAHWLADQIVTAVAGRARVSVEPIALGTAGPIARLRPWVDGRDVLVYNADAYLAPEISLAPLLNEWDGHHVRLLVVRDPARGDFGDLRFAGVSLLPARLAAQLEETPSGLYEVLWRRLHAAGELDFVLAEGTFIDCGRPRDYLAANLHASGGASVIAPEAIVDGQVTRCVVWPDSVVKPDEHLVDMIRAGSLTVPAGS